MRLCLLRPLNKDIANNYILKNASLVSGVADYIFAAEHPWTRVLAGKKVLVIHPFAESIRSQYAKRALLFENPEVLPEFELKTIQAYQSIGGNNPRNYPDWFAARDAMKMEIDRHDFDIALVGAGAYGLFLTHHCKQIGKKAVYMGGWLQILFGILGKRWDTRKEMQPLFNTHWIRPKREEVPAGHDSIEDGCYW